jgi:hypothetical protein
MGNFRKAGAQLPTSADFSQPPRGDTFVESGDGLESTLKSTAHGLVPAFTTVKAFHDVLKEANKILPRGKPFRVHFSDIAYANRNEYEAPCPTAKAHYEPIRSQSPSPLSRGRRR